MAADRNEWFAIKNKLDQVGNDQLLLPALDPEPFRRYSACVAAGSTIYVFGSEEQVEDWNPPCTRDVFYINTLCPEKGWKKLSSSLNIPRQEPYGVHIDGKIYVLGGFAPDYPFQVSTIVPEVFDTRRVEEGWRELKDREDAPVLVNGHAVLDGGKRIFVFGHMNERLYRYDVDADRWKMYHKNFGKNRWTSAFDDRVLYFMDACMTGYLFALDLSEPNNEVIEDS